eukprot:gene25204-1659_t
MRCFQFPLGEVGGLRVRDGAHNVRSPPSPGASSPTETRFITRHYRSAHFQAAEERDFVCDTCNKRLKTASAPTSVTSTSASASSIMQSMFSLRLTKLT